LWWLAVAAVVTMTPMRQVAAVRVVIELVLLTLHQERQPIKLLLVLVAQAVQTTALTLYSVQSRQLAVATAVLDHSLVTATLAALVVAATTHQELVALVFLDKVTTVRLVTLLMVKLAAAVVVRVQRLLILLVAQVRFHLLLVALLPVQVVVAVVVTVAQGK
jgi:hypothetical protein